MSEPWYAYLMYGVFQYSYYYPLFMAYVWGTGAMIYFLRWEWRSSRELPVLREYPPVSIIVPCLNEEGQIAETVSHLMRQRYPDFEVIVVDDGSSDRTGAILDGLVERFERLRVIHHAQNQGKAMALRAGALAARSDYLVTIDGDALLDENAVTWMMRHLVDGSRVGAVTGNPRIRNRSTMLGKVQVGEFSAIVGIIKRAQRVYGRVFTVSGVIAAFRKTALHRVGYWTTDMVTDDIDVSWKLQMDHWEIRYEPNALCWILMPETLRGLWRQRLRWAQGGAEVALRYARRLCSWRRRRMWIVFAEFVASTVWAYCFILIVLLWALGQLVILSQPLQVESLIPEASGAILSLTTLLQFGIGLFIDHRYDRAADARIYYWTIWYPMAYFLLAMLTTVVGLPRAIVKKRGQLAVWISPDRGVRS